MGGSEQYKIVSKHNNKDFANGFAAGFVLGVSAIGVWFLIL